MSEVRGVVVAHGDLAHCLVETTRSISGVEDAFHPVSNAGCSPAALASRIEGAIGGDAAILFVDLASGSCAHTARLVARERMGVSVIMGVNLPMLLDFVFHREMEVEELTTRLIEKARTGIVGHLSGDAP